MTTKVKNKTETKPGRPPSLVPFRTQPGRYRVKSLKDLENGANVLPHGVTVRMTTLVDGRARWTYVEEFRAHQFPSRAAAEKTIATTLEAVRAWTSPGLKVQVRGLRLTVTATSTREHFADTMVAEFLGWGGALGRVTLSQFLLTSMRFLLSGWQP